MAASEASGKPAAAVASDYLLEVNDNSSQSLTVMKLNGEGRDKQGFQVRWVEEQSAAGMPRGLKQR